MEITNIQLTRLLFGIHGPPYCGGHGSLGSPAGSINPPTNHEVREGAIYCRARDLIPTVPPLPQNTRGTLACHIDKRTSHVG